MDMQTPPRQLQQGEDPSASASSSRREFQRSFKACDGCRLKKAKCDLGSLDAPSEPPCSRCKREMRECLFTMSTRGRSAKRSSTRAQAFGAHHLARVTTSQSLADDDLDNSTAAIDALAGAALASLPDANPRIRSTRHDVPVRELDPEDAPSIGMIYGIQGSKRGGGDRSSKRKRVRQSLQPEPVAPRSEPSESEASADELDTRAGGALPDEHRRASRDSAADADPLQQYASVGLQNSKDALRVLAGVAVETRDSDASRATSIGEGLDAADKGVEGSASASHSPIDDHVDSPRHAAPSPAASAATRSHAGKRSREAVQQQGRGTTPPPLKHRYGWSKFEPVRLKLIKRSEAKHFLNFFLRRMHSFAPHCSPHLLDKSPDALSELVSREPILLGAMLSVASRYDVANHNNAHLIHPDTFHRKISKWTQEKISRSFFLPGSHTIGTIEALLILSEWATLDLHDRRVNEDASSESEDDPDGDDEGFTGIVGDVGVARSPATPAAPGQSFAAPLASTSSATRPPISGGLRGLSAKSLQRPARLDLRESEKFDDTAWMLTGTALRLAERLDIQNVATYSGISSPESFSRLNAERRMRVWMSSVHADCHLSVRLGRRISSPGLAAPFMNLVRDRTHPFLIRSDASSSIGLSDTSLATGTPRAWIAFRAHAELLQIVFRTCENLYRSRAVTERLLEDEDFVPALKSIRDDLDEWANWTQPRIEPIRDMTSLRLRVEYHYARLYANGVSLDSLKRGLGTFRPSNRVQYHSGGNRPSRDSPSGSMQIGLSTHPAYPFVREALAAAQSLIRILTVELDSMMCAPARWFLLLVMAAVFCVKATAVSDTILPLNRCAQSLQQVITALTKAAPDAVHLANRYSMYLRRLARQLILTDAKSRRKSSTGARGRGEDSVGPRPMEGMRVDLDLGEGQTFNYKVYSGRTWTHYSDHNGESDAHACCGGNECIARTRASRSTSTGALGSIGGGHTVHAASPLSATTAPLSQPTTTGRSGNSSRAHASDTVNGKVHNSGGGGTWWSTGDVLGGEMDPESFLRWLDEQTIASNTYEAPGQDAWQASPLPASSVGPTALNSAGGSTTVPTDFALVGTSPYVPPSFGAAAAANSGAVGVVNGAAALGAPATTVDPIGRAAPTAKQGSATTTVTTTTTTTMPPVASLGDALSSTPGTEHDDLLTRMWLDDALTDLASSGLDMPFL